jgi:hypothetical protein
MTLEECARVLAKIQLGDNRQADKLVLAEWFDSIGDLDFQDSIEAVSMHRQESLDYLAPAHIRRNVHAIRTGRAEAQKALDAGVVIEGHPKPTNWEAMCAAYKSPMAFRDEVAIYSQQLVTAGFGSDIVREHPWHGVR